MNSDSNFPSDIAGPSGNWYALHVRSRHEKSVARQLEAKLLDVFLPLCSAKQKRARQAGAGRVSDAALPLFPGYVFCRFHTGTRSKAIATSGVIDIVRSCGEPAPIAQTEIESIRILLNSRLQLEPWPELVAGQRVMIEDGPLNGMTGVLMEVRNCCRLVVSVELLRRSVLVEVDRSWAAPVEPERPKGAAKCYSLPPVSQLSGSSRGVSSCG